MADPLNHDAGAGVRDARPAPAFDFAMEVGKVAEFARATGAMVRDDGLVPVTFPAASALWMSPQHSAWYGITRDYRRVLHGEQRFDYPRGLPKAGMRFRGRQRFGRTYDKAGRHGFMRFTEVVTSFWTRDEEDPDVVMTSLSITLPDAPANAPTSTQQSGASPEETDDGILDRHVTDPLTITDFVRYQGASGDFNPIHHDSGFAASAGFPSPFAVGMLTAGLAAASVSRVRDPADLRSFRTRWMAQAWPGDRLTLDVMPAAHRPDGLDVVVRRDAGDVHMRAWADYA